MQNMKIGILTYHAACNFGANLQVLSTYEYLKNQGHSPIIINWMTPDLERQYKNSVPPQQVQVHKEFRENFFCMTKRCYTSEDVAQVINDECIEAVIIGSDAVVQHHPILSRIVFPTRHIFNIISATSDTLFPNPFWGDFYKMLNVPIKMVMMSVSSQNSNYRLINKVLKRDIAKSLSHFSYISTRDDWTSKMFYNITNQKILPKVTPDPVFAFNKNVNDIPSRDYILNKYSLPNKYYLVSFHNQTAVSYSWLEKFKELSENNGITPVALPFPKGVTFEHPFEREIQIPLSPIDWYCLLKYSSGYIGHNMHPIVICLHNSVPCYSFDNYGILRMRLFAEYKSSKIYHLMKLYGLLDNWCSAKGVLYKSPTPEKVLLQLQNFDTKSVERISSKRIEDYAKMMEDIISILEN